MTAPLSMDLRERIVETYLAGGVRQEDVAERYQVSQSVVSKLVQQYRDEGSLKPHVDQCGRKPKLTDDDEAALLKDMEERPDATLEERAQKLGGKVCVSTVWSALRRLGQRYKKSPNTRPSSRDRMLPAHAATGSTASPALMPSASSLSTRQG